MLNKFAKFILVATSFAPIFLTLWLIDLGKAYDSQLGIMQNLTTNWHIGWKYLGATVFMAILCYSVVWLSGRRLEKLPVKIKAVKTVDDEIIGFLVIYLLPLMNQTNGSTGLLFLGIITLIYFLIILNSHAYHFNPLLAFAGYHFYEVTIEGNITYVLITRQKITDCKNISQVVQLTEYMILELPNAK